MQQRAIHFLPSSSPSARGTGACRVNFDSNVGLGELNIGGGGIGPISLKGIGGSGSSDSIKFCDTNGKHLSMTCWSSAVVCTAIQ